MTEIKIVKNGKVLEVLKIRNEPQEFVIYRGSLFQLVKDNEYEERSYIELY